jgi:RimJ/RimL family protein N-acetyltransferase
MHQEDEKTIQERLAGIIPTFGLSVRWDDLELRVPDDADLLDLADLAAAGVHGPDLMPFGFPWTRGTADEVRRNVLTFHWGARQRHQPGDWTLELGVYAAGRVVGIQSITATDFPVTRVAHTGSWLGLAHQGDGIGTRMRLAVLHLAFEELGAEEMTSEAFVDNPASNAVSRRLGYEPNGTYAMDREGKPARQQRYRLTRETWEKRPTSLRPAIEVDGVAPVRELFGIAGNHAAADELS